MTLMLSSFVLFSQGWIGTTNNNIEAIRAVDMMGNTQNNNNRVAIGLPISSNPSAKLHVQGGVRFQNLPNSMTNTRILTQSTNGTLAWRDGQSLFNGQAWQLGGNQNLNLTNNSIGSIGNVNVRGIVNNNRIFEMTNNCMYILPRDANAVTVDQSNTSLYVYGKLRTQVLGGVGNPGIPSNTLDNWLGTSGIAENRHGDSYFRGYYGVVIDKDGGTVSGVTSRYNNQTQYTQAGNLQNLNRGEFIVRTALPNSTYRGDFRIDQSGDAFFINNVTAGGIYLGSDRNLKSNLKPISETFSTTDLLDQITGYTYDYKNQNAEGSSEPRLGFVAQEVQKVLPTVVKNTGSGHLSVNYIDMLPILWEANKELKKELDELKKQMNELYDLISNVNEIGTESKTRLDRSSIILYPNPTNDVLYINSESLSSDLKVLFSSMDGKFIEAQKVSKDELLSGTATLVVGHLRAYRTIIVTCITNEKIEYSEIINFD